jgi:valine--pyruvate aminotransferase
MDRGIPLLVDNAYGAPFPQILFTNTNLIWNENIILVMSLSKIGLPSARTGIIVASDEIISALSAANAIASLSIGSIGQVLTAPLILNGELMRLGKEVIMPFYRGRSLFAQKRIDETMAGLPYRIHVSEGALFLWIWFKDLPITTTDLYQRLKQRRTLVVPGKYFFFGSGAGDDISWHHQHECIRINYGRDAEEVSRGIDIIANEARKAYGG